MIELLGPMPPKFALSGEHSKDFFDYRGELRHIKRLKYWPLEDVLRKKYGFHSREAEEIASFLTPMLQYENRAQARDMLDHPWLNGVEPVLEGEHQDREAWRDLQRPWREWEKRRSRRY